MRAAVVLIHINVHPLVILVYVDAVIHMGLIPHLDHQDVLIGVDHIILIIVEVEIIVTVLQTETTTIVITRATMKGDIATLMVSHRLWAIVMSVTQINIKINSFKTATRVTIIETTLTITIMIAMVGFWVLNMAERVNFAIPSKQSKQTIIWESFSFIQWD